jgi:hypothetical protein
MKAKECEHPSERPWDRASGHSPLLTAATLRHAHDEALAASRAKANLMQMIQNGRYQFEE